MSERPQAYSGSEWRQVPDDVLETALRDAEEYVLDDRPNALEFALCLAIIGERARCAAAIVTEAKRLAANFQAITATDLGRRQMLHWFETGADQIVSLHLDTLTDEAKARRSKALDELGALDGEERT